MVWCVKIVLLLNTCTAYESCLVTIKILYFQGNANLESWVDEQSTVHRISFLRVYRNSLGKLTVQSNKLIKCNLLFVHRLFWIFFFYIKCLLKVQNVAMLVGFDHWSQPKESLKVIQKGIYLSHVIYVLVLIYQI